MGCVWNCVSHYEGLAIAAVIEAGSTLGYSFAFSEVENAGQALSGSQKVDRISIWATKAASKSENAAQAPKGTERGASDPQGAIG